MKTITKFICVAFALFGFACFASTHAATIYDPAKEFSATDNPNGVWSYGYSLSHGGLFTLDLTHENPYGADEWHAFSTPPGCPCITHNPTDSTLSYLTVV